MGPKEGILCTKSHEYILQEEGVCIIGITDYAVEQLGDIVFVELPEVGDEIAIGEPFATIESVKAASEVYMPVTGEIVEINEALIDKPELINEDTFEAGWIIKVKSNSAEEELSSAMEYEDYTEEVG